MPSFTFNPPPGWPELPANWVPSLGWGPQTDWATPDGWELWTIVPDAAPASTVRPLFGARKLAEELDAEKAKNFQYLTLLAEAEEREHALELVVAEYETVKRGLDEIGALEPLQLLLRLNTIGAQMQAGIDGMGEAAREAPAPVVMCAAPFHRQAQSNANLRAGRTRLL